MVVPALAAVTVAAANTGKPNIVLFLCDDMDYTLGAWTPMKQTTELYSKKGATATNWFIHTPVCCPSRGELLSGRYFHNIRVSTPSGGCMHVNTSVVNPNSFGAHIGQSSDNAVGPRGTGYTMGWFGKHMNQCPQQAPPGWDCPTCAWFANGGGADAEPGGYLNASFSYYMGGKPVTPSSPLNGNTPGHYKGSTAGEYGGYTTSIIANKSIEWLHTVAHGPEPFFLAVAPKAPHVAATPAPWYATGTFIDSLQAPRGGAYNASKELLADHHWLIAQQDIITMEQGAAIDDLFRNRWRTLLSVDDAVAGVIGALDNLNVLDNTYLFFTSDHGYNLGQHRLPSCKLNVYDHDIRIPMVIMGPGIVAGSTFNFIGSNVDLAPTFLALAGIDAQTVSPPMDGKSILAQLINTGHSDDRVLNKAIPEPIRESITRERAAGVPWRDHHWVEYYSLGDVVRTGHLVDDPNSNTYRALRFVGSERFNNTLYAEFTALKDWNFGNYSFVEMYNVDEDPHQLHNIAKSTSASLKAELHTLATQQFNCEGSSCT